MGERRKVCTVEEEGVTKTAKSMKRMKPAAKRARGQGRRWEGRRQKDENAVTGKENKRRRKRKKKAMRGKTSKKYG